MPATKPVDVGSPISSSQKGEPFTVKYDKLVIAVGAYSQSESFFPRVRTLN